MAWWIWILIGLGCLGLEVMTPGGIIMLFFGVSAGVVGVFVGVGLGGPLWAQILLFSVLSIVSLLTLRGPIIRRMRVREKDQSNIDSLVGETAVLLGDLSPGAIGKGELRGTGWTVQNVGQHKLTKGQRCAVRKVDGLRLHVGAD
ncbi:MAG: NfeD family protein [Acidobacteriota bacterium]